METITTILTYKVSDAFAKCGFESSLGLVTASDRLDLCQFQCNGAFSAAKMYKKPPFIIAQQVVDILSKDIIFKDITVFKPGFINMSLSDDYLAQRLINIVNDVNLGVPQIGKDKKIIIDYGGPNVAKPLHIGHLRSAIIGESVKLIARACGSTVYGDVHLGDWGLQIGLVITELSHRYPEWKCFSDSFNPESDSVNSLDIDLLNEVYPYASARSKEDDTYKEEAHRITHEFQNGRPGYTALWKEILRVSIADLKSNYEKLHVNFDFWYGESDASKYEKELIDILNSKKLLYMSEGAQVVDVSEPDDKTSIPPVIIKKSDNSSIYATTDLATIIQRQKDFSPDAIWYIVDNRQSLHFMQIFRCAKKAGLVPEKTELGHYGFGTMNGSDGKPYKTRDGGVMRLSDLVDTVTNSALSKLKESGFVSQDKMNETSRKVGMAAIKFGDMINQRSKDYIFDLDKFLSFEGKTGTYLLYMITRINSILKKVGVSFDTKMQINGIYSDSERDLILRIILSGEAFNRAYLEKAPNYICENAYIIATSFSKFYYENHIIDEQNIDKKKSWIALILTVRRVLIKHLDVLGIETVENM